MRLEVMTMGWTPPDGIYVPRQVYRVPEKETSMEEVGPIGLDTAKSVFQAHAADVDGRQIFGRRLTRRKVIEVFAAQPP